MNKNRVFGILFVFSIMLFTINASASQNTKCSMVLAFKNVTTGYPITSGTVRINISATNDCSGSVYSESFVDPMNADGVAALLLGNSTSLPMVYNKDYYFCVEWNGNQIGSSQNFRGCQGGFDSINVTWGIGVGGDAAPAQGINVNGTETASMWCGRDADTACLVPLWGIMYVMDKTKSFYKSIVANSIYLGLPEATISGDGDGVSVNRPVIITTTNKTNDFLVSDVGQDVTIAFAPQSTGVNRGYVGRFQASGDVNSGFSYYAYIANGGYHNVGGGAREFIIQNQYVGFAGIGFSGFGIHFYAANVSSNGEVKNVTEVMRIAGAYNSAYQMGNVGIGTGQLYPRNKLDVGGAVVIGSAVAGVSQAPADGLIVQGNTMIATTYGALGNLTVGGTAGIHLLSVAESSVGGRLTYHGDGAGWKLSIQARNGSGSLVGIPMIIKDSGGVGIGGDDAPAQGISVNGTVTASDFYVDNAGGATISGNGWWVTINHPTIIDNLQISNDKIYGTKINITSTSGETSIIGSGASGQASYGYISFKHNDGTVIGTIGDDSFTDNTLRIDTANWGLYNGNISIDSGNFIFLNGNYVRANSLAGSGNAFVCADSSGNLYRSATACA